VQWEKDPQLLTYPIKQELISALLAIVDTNFKHFTQFIGQVQKELCKFVQRH
jgi:preprotein translocase subunit SecE